MKPICIFRSLISLVGFSVSLLAADNDIPDAVSSQKSPPVSTNKVVVIETTISDVGSSQKSLSLSTNDVVVIETASGASAVIQFTSFSPESAAYRWRYRAAKLQPTTSGTGQVRESYDRNPDADGRSILAPRADHDTTIRAGEIRAEWSGGSTTNGWLYYHPSRAKIRVFGSGSFEKEF